MNNKLFNKDSTDSCKGVALILLLWHHLFFTHPEFGYITYKIALLSKVCVAIFVLLSGYGFSESIKLKNVGLYEFYQKRLVALYFNYWFISLIFVIIGILFMDRTFQDVFTSHAYVKFTIQMTGLHRFAYSEYGYNATWWYMSVIISLTILFPFIFDLTKKYGALVLFFFLIILLPNSALFPVINTWLLPFALGIYISQKNYITAISNHLNIYGSWRFFILMTAIVLMAILRSHIPLLGGEKIDWLFGGLIILFVFELTTAFRLIEKALGFLGQHLFNVFLFHTFICGYYWSEFIYSFQNPLLIFSCLLFICIITSLVIEKIKRKVYFGVLIGKIMKLRVPASIEIAFQKNAPVGPHSSHR